MTNPSRTSPLLFAAAALLITSACGGGDAPPPEEETETSGTEVVAEPEPPPPEPTPQAPSPVRVIHVAAAAHQTPVSGTADGAEAPQFPELAYQTPSAYVDVQPAVGATSAAFSFAGGEGGPTADHTAELTAATPATLLILTSAEDPAQLSVTVLSDEAHTVTGQARGRFVNALMGAAALDLCIPGASRRDAGRAIFSNVAYGDVGGIPSFPSRYQPMTLAGVTSLQIRTANAEAPCSGAIVGTAALPPVDHNVAHNLTLIAVGNSGRTPRVPKQLLVCEDAPGSGACVPVPLAR